MKRFTSLLAAAGLLLTSVIACQMEDQDFPDVSPVPVEYASVNTDVGRDADGVEGAETKSVCSIDVENFHKALLVAFNPNTGKVLTYGTNASEELFGQPVCIETTSKSFNWELPLQTAMDVYVLTNYGDLDMSAYLSKGASLTVSDLESLTFTCNSASDLQALETSGYGLPMSGITHVSNTDISTGTETLSVRVKKLFAKYDLYFDISEITANHANVVAESAVIYNMNPTVHYFTTTGDKSAASNPTSAYDRATSEQLDILQQGGSTNKVTFYVLENMQGDIPGASNWASVYQEIGATALKSCTFLTVSVMIADDNGRAEQRPYRIYLGKDDMKSNFDVVRNVHKTIRLKLSDTAPRGNNFVFTDNLFVEDRSVIVGETGEAVTLYFKTTENLSDLTFDVQDIATGVSVPGYSFSTPVLASSDTENNVPVNKATVVMTIPESAASGKVRIDGGNESVRNSRALKVVNITYEYVIKPSSTAVQTGETITMQLIKNTYTDGVLTNSENVTTEGNWSSTPSLTLGTSGSGDTAVETATSDTEGTYKISVVAPDGNTYDVDIKFTDYVPVVTYTYEIYAPVTEGETGDVITMQLIRKTYLDGEYSTSDNVTFDGNWSSSSSYLSLSGAGSGINARENAVASKAGTYTVTVKDPEGGSHSVTLTFNPVITYTYDIVAGSTSAEVNETIFLRLMRYTYADGELQGPAQNVTSTGNWGCPSPYVSITSGSTVKYVTSSVAGSYNVYCTDPDGGEHAVALTFTEHVPEITYNYYIEASATSAEVGEIITLKFWRETYSDGHLTSTEDVTSSGTWNASSGLSLSGSTTKSATSSTAGSYTVSCRIGGYSDSVTLTFTKSGPVVSYEYELDYSATSAQVGEKISLMLIRYTLEDGTRTGETLNVTSSVSWSAPGLSMTSSGTSSKDVTASSAGNYTVSVTDPNGESHSVTLTFTKVPVNIFAFTGGDSSAKPGDTVTMYFKTTGSAKGCSISNSAAYWMTLPIKTGTTTESGETLETGSVTMTIPSTATSGTVTVNGSNGKAGDTWSITVTKPEPVITYTYELEASSYSANVKEKISLQMFKKTYTDGKLTNTENVTSACSHNSIYGVTFGSTGSAITVTTSNAGSYDVVITHPEGGSHTATLTFTKPASSKTISFSISFTGLKSPFIYTAEASEAVPCNITITDSKGTTWTISKGSTSSSPREHPTFKPSNATEAAQVRVTRAGANGGTQTTWFDSTTNTNYTFTW